MPDLGYLMTDFHTYFSTVAQISGGLLGLVFVALTFNPKTLGLHHNAGMRSLAEQVFADFLMVMVIALVLLIPHFDTASAGAVVAFLGLLGVFRIARSAAHLFHGAGTLRWRLLQRFWLSLLGSVGFVAAGVLLYQGAQASTAWSALVFSPILLLIGGARSAWLLIMQNAE